MATKDQFTTVIARLDAATNKIATKQRADAEKLREALENAGILGPDEQAVLDSLGATATALEALGADSENPVPEEEDPPAGDGGQV